MRKGIQSTRGWVLSRILLYGDVPPKWVTFSPKILRHGSHFGQKSLDMGPILVKKSLEEGPISLKLRKNGKISHF